MLLSCAHSPPILEALDVEPQCGADRCDVLPVKLLDDRSFAGVIQPKNEYPHLLLLLFDFPQNPQKAHAANRRKAL